MKEIEWSNNWQKFKCTLPHQQLPFSKKNWGNPNHSLCSYQGKLKPAIAHQLVSTFVPEGGSLFDPFCGVGTIPFEAALNNRLGLGMDISAMAYYISQAKLGAILQADAYSYLDRLSEFIGTHSIDAHYYAKHADFGLNKTLKEYYEEQTFKEILLSRMFFNAYTPDTPSKMVVIASFLHILHGNRPYALSRKSHPITPYAPTGDFVYKNVMEKLTAKVKKYFTGITAPFVPGRIFFQDATTPWPDDITNLDAIITSPPFFDSTRFYSANWIRLWFSGWEPEDFITMPKLYVDEIQKKHFNIYDKILSQAKERLKKDGVMVFHLGKSRKCNMGMMLQHLSRKWFDRSELFSESVSHCNSFGIKDIGSVTDHQYLLLW